MIVYVYQYVIAAYLQRFYSSMFKTYNTGILRKLLLVHFEDFVGLEYLTFESIEYENKM